MPDFNDLIAASKKMSEKMKEAQEALKKIEVEGVSGGGMVKVFATAKGEIKRIILDESLMQIFQLYLDLDNLYILFSTEGFLLVFWLHFISINLFLGSWISSDGVKYSMPRSLVGVSLIFVYYMGPVGLVLHWFLRIFYAKKINLYD